jgi:RimJ/RimL family protein N-acetyltransferase
MIIGLARHEEALAWARSRMNLEGPVGPCLTWSMVDDQGFKAVFVLSDINPISACIHYAARPNCYWMTREFQRGIMGLAFDQLELSRLTGPTRGSNERALKIAEKWGFKVEGTLRKAFPDGDDCYLFGLLREEWQNHKRCVKLSS